MAAYKHFAASTDFSTNKLGPEEARVDFMKAVKKWIDKEGKFLLACSLITVNNERLLENLVLHCAMLSGKAELVKLVLSARPELLEVKSIDGWTPLLAAALCKQVESIRILLEAKADPFATDMYGRNMLHLFLVFPGGSHLYDPETLSSFVRAVEKPVFHKLLEERCVESPGGLTPLARWVDSNVRHVPVAVSTDLLEASTTKAMEMWDGRGFAPLHTVRFPYSYNFVPLANCTTRPDRNFIA
jgi:hypothetical protein